MQSVGRVATKASNAKRRMPRESDHYPIETPRVDIRYRAPHAVLPLATTRYAAGFGKALFKLAVNPTTNDTHDVTSGGSPSMKTTMLASVNLRAALVPTRQNAGVRSDSPERNNFWTLA